MNEEEKEAIRDLIDSSNLSQIGDGTVITSNKTINTILNLIEKTTKENEELKESNKKLYEIGQEMCKQDKYTSENYIPVQKIENKIEKLKERIEKDCKAKIDILQELLEEQ